ncbi:MAG: AMP-binding protein [Christensenellaceae bacterium]|nr:AMP-binding protein [Christensenellaceae bacterium]
MAKRKYFPAERLRDLRELIRRADRNYGSTIAYKQFGPKRVVEEYTFGDLNNDMNAFGTQLINMGLKDAHIALLGESRYEWVISYLSVLNGVGVGVPLDKELLAPDLSMLINKSECTAIICTAAYAKIAEEILETSPQVKAVIVMDPRNARTALPESFYSMQELIERGKALVAEGDTSYIDAYIDINKMTEIVFTSGTTGANKGVMLSHNNLVSVVYACMRLIRPGGMSVSVLPIHHTYECSCHILGSIYCGNTVCFNDSLKRVMPNIAFFQPKFSIMVPMFPEAMYRAIKKQTQQSKLEHHIAYGIKASNILRKFGIDRRRYFFKPIHDKFGGNLEQIVCGGAPLRRDLIEFFDNIGINLINGYGITECAPLVSAHISFDVHKKKFGSVGHIVPGCTVRISNKDSDGIGDIEVKGDNVMLGYYKDEAATKASFTEDGWFITGDRGYLDRDGYLYLSGREKNLIILPNGKNVHPEELEEIITSKLSYVEEVVVFAHTDEKGEQSQICAAFYIDPQWFAEKNIADSKAFMREEIRKINDLLPRYKQIADVYVVTSEFEKTTTKKIKRQLVEGRVINV